MVSPRHHELPCRHQNATVHDGPDRQCRDLEPRRRTNARHLAAAAIQRAAGERAHRPTLFGDTVRFSHLPARARFRVRTLPPLPGTLAGGSRCRAGRTGRRRSRRAELRRAGSWRNYSMSSTFAELVASRQKWIEEVLKPWCRAAPRKELVQAEQDWPDIAGQVDARATLWVWAWSRFAGLVHDGLPGIDETHLVRITTRDGRVLEGYPDNRESQHGQLRVLCESPPGSGRQELSDPISIDDVVTVEQP